MSSFHYEFILSKRSSLAKVWLAAHWEKKLSKVQIFETNLQSSVYDILHPTTPIALRTSSHLLVGLVRIYSRKAKYLLRDCSEALVNIKVAFRPGVSALETPKKRKRAQDISDCPFLITESVDLLDKWIPEVSNTEMDCSLNQSKVEEITIQEEPMKVSSLEDYFDDEGFGDMFDSDITEQELGKGDSVFLRVHSITDSDSIMDGFSYDSSSVTEFSDPFMLLTPVKEANEIEKLKNRTAAENETDVPKFILELDEEMPEVERSPELHHVEQILDFEMENSHANDMIILDPVMKMPTKPMRKSLKRKLLIDSEISIDREEYFDQIKNVSILCGPPAMAPGTKCQMKQITCNVQSLFLLHTPDKSLWPHLHKMLQCSPAKKNSTSSNLSEEVIALSGTNENDEENFGSVFIPLQDVEYSSDEDEVVDIFHEDQQSCIEDIVLVSTEQNEDAVSESSEQEEDILHDKFCSFVETTVLKSHPDPINFQQVVSNSTPTRKNVARKFLKCLLMQRDARLQLHQASHFSEIYLYSGNKPLECSQ